jgi:hypothetical protein
LRVPEHYQSNNVHVFHALAGRGGVADNDDAAQAVVANKDQLRDSQMTNESIINRKVSFNI